MGKKNNKTVTNNVVNNNSTITATSIISPSATTLPAASSSSSSSSLNAEAYHQVIDKLLSLNLNSSEDEILYNKKKLLNQYNQSCSDNILNKQRVLYLSQDLTKLEATHERLLKEYTKVKNEYSTSNTKYQKLISLSNQLSERIKDSDHQSNLELKKQQEQRLEISQKFSTDITHISQQFEVLIKRREEAINENQKLKLILNQYLEEYNTYNQQLESMKLLEQASDGLETTTCTTITTTIPCNDGSSSEVNSLTQINHIENDFKDMEDLEIQNMEYEDLYLKFINTLQIEIDLKEKVLINSKTFDNFQKQLVDCNQDFKSKQQTIEITNQKIQLIDKNKLISMNRISECIQSTNKQVDDIKILESEKQKYLKLIEKCHSLNDTLSKEIKDYSTT